ncbi:transposase domain-containing protein [Sphingopyxis alaskensis]|uniref:transposase domain-containing protein n=1 Tax=Sphingopyxis alaskensis TaxID=117207 RepID=UPI00203AB506|nr:transposase domain-containing protein [Sphingopyxis alaskensis]MCM3419027.1 Mu transposase C-terminal domain-containing protein [Sphingopyxis alaskensis]
MKFHGGKFWFTAAELADLKLPGLPASKRKVNERAAKECWALQVDSDGMPLARSRQARGGGLEYHVSILPAATQAALVRRGISSSCERHEDERLRQGTIWSWYEAQSDKVKAEAERRNAILSQVYALIEQGIPTSTAVSALAVGEKIGMSTLYSWMALVEGVAAADRLPHLAPRRKGGGREASVDAELWHELISDYLRPEQPTFSSCYWRTSRIAEARGLSLPGEKTLKRRFDREIDKRLVTAKRGGQDALRQMLPPQRRSRAHFHAMEAVNIDGHKFDCLVRLPDGREIRPIVIAIQDLFSGKMLAWRIGESENALLTRLTFADLFANYGIPKACTLDNGRAFAAKEITGGAKTRYRFTIRADDPTGLLTALGVKTNWARPYHGQAKPIERFFGDVAQMMRGPEFAGAWTGNHIDNKPDYKPKAIEWDVFVKAVNAGVAALNARRGRRTETANGRSYDETFAASYATAPIGKATEEQLRLALLTADRVTTDRKSGMIKLAHNRYWAPELMQIAGQKVTIRFDPDHLHGDIHVYDQAGRFLVTAQLIEDSGFDSLDAARARAKLEREHRRAARELEEREQLLTASAIAAMLPDMAEEQLPEPQVIRPIRVAHRNGAATAAKAEHQETSFMSRFAAAVPPLRLVE